MIIRHGMTVEECRAAQGSDTLTFVASTDTPDRMGDIVEQNFDLRAFRKNPVFLWGHDSRALPIGKIVRVWTEKVAKAAKSARRTLIEVAFAPKDVHPFAHQVKQMYEAGFLKAVSIGFRPLERAQVTESEREALGLGRFGERFTKSELLEVSAVSIPANPEALEQGKKALVTRGYAEDDAEQVVRDLQGAPEVTEADIAAITKAVEALESDLSEETRDALTVDDLATLVRAQADEIKALKAEVESLKAAPKPRSIAIIGDGAPEAVVPTHTTKTTVRLQDEPAELTDEELVPRNFAWDERFEDVEIDEDQTKAVIEECDALVEQALAEVATKEN